MRTWSKSPSRRDGGLTLIELSVAIMIVAVLLAVALPAFNDVTNGDLKGTAVRISGAARTCFGEAAVKNVTLRVAYDLDANAYWVEAYPGAFQVSRAERDLDEVRDEEKEKDEEEKKKKELADRWGRGDEVESAGAPSPKFVPVKVAFEEPQRLPRGVKFAGVKSPQFKQVVKDGRAYTHFFPNGWAEPTLVYLQEDGGKSMMTLEMEPLTGRVILHDGELDWDDIEEIHRREDK